MAKYRATPKKADHTVFVYFRDGFFLLTVQDARGGHFETGADHELPDLGRLMDVSDTWLDWEESSNVDLARALRTLEIAARKPTTQRALARVF